MILLLPLLYCVATTTAQVVPLYIATDEVPRDQTSPYIPDYSRIDWSLCGTGKDKPVCLISNDCNAPNVIASSLKKYKPTDAPNNVCGQGIQIRAISPSRWVFHVQFFVPGIRHDNGGTPPRIDPAHGMKLYLIEEPLKELPFVSCTFDKEGKPKEKLQKDFADLTLKQLKLTSRESKSYTDTDKMMCVFEIEATDGKSVVADVLKKLLVDKPGLATTRLNLRVTNHAKISTVQTWKAIIDVLVRKSDSMIRNTILPPQSKELEFARNFTFFEVIKDFSALGCADPQARLVIDIDDGLREVIINHMVPGTTLEYSFKYAKDVLGWTKAVKLPEAADPVGVACAVRTCHLCPPLLPVSGCEACSPPVAIFPPRHKDCPVLECPDHMWTFDDGILPLIAHDSHGLRCSNVTGKYGWFRVSNGYPVERASCAGEKDCTKTAPLNATCVAGSKDCVQISEGRAKCSTGYTLRFKNSSTKDWTNLPRSLYCDSQSGAWYSGSDLEEKFNHTFAVKCEEIYEPLLQFNDEMTHGGFLFALIACFSTFIALMIIAGCVIHWYRKTRPKAYLKHLKVRPSAQEKPLFENLSEVVNMPKLDQETFVQVIQEFQLYSIQERIDFVDHSVTMLGTKVEIDQFLSLFNHCIEMESDFRVWRLLALGYKIIIIVLNQMNKSRNAMRLSEHLKAGTDVLLNRIGFNREHGEDYSITETRNVAFQLKLITNCRHTIQQLMEEAVLTRGNEDLSRRRMIYAYKLRGCNSQEERYKNWEPRAGLQIESRDEIANAVLTLKYGGAREHFVYGMCSGKDPEVVQNTLGRMINGDFTRAEILAGFQAGVEDCFDMRYGARHAFINNHPRLKEKVPVGTPEYMKIFDMFSRFANLEFGADDNWLIKFVYTNGSYTTEEKKMLPMAAVAQGAETGRVLLRKAANFVLKPTRDPPHEPPGTNEGGPPGDMKPRTDPSQAEPTTKSGQKLLAIPDSKASAGRAPTSSQKKIALGPPSTSTVAKPTTGGPDSSNPTPTGSAPSASGSGHRGGTTGSGQSGPDSTGPTSSQGPKAPSPVSGSRPEESGSRPDVSGSRPSQ